MAIIYFLIRDFGPAAQAGFGLGSRVMQAMFLPLMAISFAIAPIAGQNFGVGAKRINEADPRVKAAIYMSAPVNLAGRDAKNLYGSIKIPGMQDRKSVV